MRILSRYTRSFRTPLREVNVLSRRNHPCNFSVNLKVRPNAKPVQLKVKNNEAHEPTLLLAMKYSLEVEAASPVSTIASTIATLALPPPPKSVPPTAAKGLLPPVALM